jgi:hypothetical protein
VRVHGGRATTNLGGNAAGLMSNFAIGAATLLFLLGLGVYLAVERGWLDSTFYPAARSLWMGAAVLLGLAFLMMFLGK